MKYNTIKYNIIVLLSIIIISIITYTYDINSGKLKYCINFDKK
jgi:preprotein translocase subunit SecE